MLLAVIGLRCVARGTRARWEPVGLGIGSTLMIIGFVLPAASAAFFPGILVLVITLLKGIASKSRAASRAADCWQWRG